MLRQVYVLPRWDRSCKSNFLPQPVTVIPGQPVPALTPQRQAPGGVATEVSIFKSLAWLDSEKSPLRKRESNPGSSALEVDALTR